MIDFKETPKSSRRPGTAIGLMIGTLLGLLAIPFLGVAVEGFAMGLGAFLGVVADPRQTMRERFLCGGLAIGVIALAVMLNLHRL